MSVEWKWPESTNFLFQSNRVTKIEGLDALVNLDQLYLSHNGIEKIEGLDKLVCSF